MRTVLAWLGLIDLDRDRREPVAVPAWAPYAAAGAVALGTGLLASFLSVLLRMIAR
jgi:hypothetical protein